MNASAICACTLSRFSHDWLCAPMHCSLPVSSIQWDSPGKNTGVDFHFLLQGIFLAQGSNSCLLRWQADSLPLNHQGRANHTNGNINLKVVLRENVTLITWTNLATSGLGNFVYKGLRSKYFGLCRSLGLLGLQENSLLLCFIDVTFLKDSVKVCSDPALWASVRATFKSVCSLCVPVPHLSDSHSTADSSHRSCPCHRGQRSATHQRLGGSACLVT